MKSFTQSLYTVLFTLLFAINTFSQTGSIKGKIETADGKPAELVNVSLEGTTIGSTTNANGEYKINNVKAGNYTLVVSYIGLQTKEIEIEIRENKTTNVPLITLKENAEELQEVVVRDNRHTNDKSEYVAKIPLKEIENPQVYNTINLETMKEQSITNFDDVLNNVPGIYRLWESTGRGYGDGTAYFALRGFETQATMVNGIPGLTSGSLDPANIERIEVIKGPSSTLFGSSLISYGGLVNTVTKRPYNHFGGEASYTSGSFGLNRITADVNVPLNDEKNIALRLNAAYHSENSFQDAGFKKSTFIAPSLSYVVNDKLSFLINTEFIQQEGTNPVMLFLNRYALLEYKNLDDLNYNNKLSFTSNDLSIKNPRYNLQLFMNYKLSDEWTSQTVVSRGSAGSYGYYSYLWDDAITTNQFDLYISRQNAQTLTTDLQQNFNGDFYIGVLRNRMVIGFDYFSRNTIDNSSGYPFLMSFTPQGEVGYVEPYSGDTMVTRYLSRQSVDDLLSTSPISNSNAKDETYSAYISDVVNITPQLIAMASLRVDYFNNEGDIFTDEDDYNQTALSPKFGLLYQPIEDKLSIFANYMNGFKNVAPSQVADADGSNPRIKTFEPEHANQYEFGVKTNLFDDKLISTISYYDIKVDNVVISDAQNIHNSIQGGKVESKGFEVDVNTNPFEGLNLIAGYSYNDSKVLKGEQDNIWFQEGKRPVSAGPQNLFNAWVTYEFGNGLLENFGLGFGANSASELIVLDSDVTGKFVLPGYTILNTSLFYKISNFFLTLNINNLTNKEYYKGYSTINPQKPRNILASVHFGF